MNIVSTSDLYEACYYLINGCTLEGVETLQVGIKTVCQLSFQGKDIYGLRDVYLRGDSIVNLTNFRTAYSRLMQATYFAKKEHSKKLKSDLGGIQ